MKNKLDNQFWMQWGEKKAKNWFKHRETVSRMRRMPEPYDNIWIGTDPTDGMTKEIADSFDAIVNVSCTPCAYFYPSRPDQRMHWYPVNECGYWGYGVFFFIKRVLDFHYERGDKVYLHCHAGAQRSPTNFVWWLVSRGHSIEEAICLELGSKVTDERLAELKEDARMWDYRVWHDRRNGNVPKNLEEMYRRMESTRSFAGALISGGHLDETFEVLCEGDMKVHRHYDRWRWYYTAKRWIRDRKEQIHRWRNGLVVVQTSSFSSVTCKKEDVERVKRENHKWFGAEGEYERKTLQEHKELEEMWAQYDRENQ